MLRKLITDAIEMTRAGGPLTVTNVLRTVATQDSYAVMVLTRAREAARRWHVPGVNRALRLAQIAMFGVEVGKDVQMGPGVLLVHTVGTVIGGDAKIGARVRLMGNNTIGTARDNGYPVLEEDVVVGAGARILGPVRVGRGARIGANAVVLSDVPAGSVAVGIPASVRPRAPVGRPARKGEPGRT